MVSLWELIKVANSNLKKALDRSKANAKRDSTLETKEELRATLKKNHSLMSNMVEEQVLRRFWESLARYLKPIALLIGRPEFSRKRPFSSCSMMRF